jgi:hypothetical protein
MAIPQTEKRFDAAAYLAWEEHRSSVTNTSPARCSPWSACASRTMSRRATSPRSCARHSKAVRVVFSSKPSRRALKPPIASSIPTSSSPAIRATALTPDYVSHPLLVAEVLSESTAAFDRGRKFAAYRKLESLQDYVLVDLAAQRIEVFRRDARITGCFTTTARRNQVELASLALQLPVEEMLEDTAKDLAAETPTAHRSP